MNDVKLFNELENIAGSENVRINEPMSAHTTFKIGGGADYFVEPEDNEKIRQIVLLCNSHDIPYFMMGNGSNLLVSDNGFRGVIVQLYNRFNKIEVIHNEHGNAVDKNNVVCVRVQAGTLLGRLGNEAERLGLSGFEFASGIPGTMGGAVMMNAGAYGGEMKDILISALVMDKNGKIFELFGEELELGYRSSIISRDGYIVLEAVIGLTPASKEQIRDRMNELANARKEKQPLEYPSAGSTFKRPVGYFAGKLITDAGMKGHSSGGAMVSLKHAGFVVNSGNATAQDVINLTDEVRNKVKELYGVELELEVKKLGF